MFRQRLREVAVVQDRAQVALHLGAVAGDEKIRSGAEKTLAVRPRRGDQRDAAGQRLEDPDRGNARQRFDVRPARNMNRHPVATEGGGHLALGIHPR